MATHQTQSTERLSIDAPVAPNAAPPGRICPKCNKATVDDYCGACNILLCPDCGSITDDGYCNECELYICDGCGMTYDEEEGCYNCNENEAEEEYNVDADYYTQHDSGGH